MSQVSLNNRKMLTKDTSHRLELIIISSQIPKFLFADHDM